MSHNDEVLSQESTEPIVSKPPRRATLIFGGWLTISAGVLSLANGLLGIYGESTATFNLDVGFSRTDLCGAVLILIGIIAIIGGVCAFRGRYLSLSIAGAMLGMLGAGYIGFFLGLISLVLYTLSSGDL